MKAQEKKIAIIMGSSSDYPTMEAAVEILKEFNMPFEVKILSAHRTPELMLDFAKTAKEQGFAAIIAGAGGAAHLPGMVASATSLPVIGVPVNSSNSVEGIDSLLSIVQMPKGVPVATMAIDGAANAALFALRMLGAWDEDMNKMMVDYQEGLKKKVAQMNKDLKV